MSEQTRDLLGACSQILLRCWLFGSALLLVWFACWMLPGNVIHEVHGKMFALSQHELDLIHYCGMGLVKLFVLLCFLFPWLAIRLVLRGQKLSHSST